MSPTGWYTQRQREVAVFLTSLACLWGAYANIQMIKPMAWNWIGSDGASAYIRHVDAVLKHVPKQVEVLGYLSDEGKTPGPWNDRSTRFSHFCLAQYAALPRVLYPSPSYEWVLARPENLETPQNFYTRLPSGFQKVSESGGKLFLLKQGLVFQQDEGAALKKETQPESVNRLGERR